ncbi:MAG: carboxypeptidase-like regulatory domain-containing protein [Bacteroidota bacterium]
MKLKTTIALFILVLTFLIKAQTIIAQTINLTGIVMDSTIAEPVPFATLSLTSAGGAITDASGTFNLPVKHGQLDDTLQITCIGYQGIKIPMRELSLSGNNTIYLEPSVYEMNDVVIKGKSRRIPRAKAIITDAIAKLAENYPADTVVYEGYYREYLKDDARYLNLFESILYLKEFMRDTIYDFDAHLAYKRFNRDFPVDSTLLAAYDNQAKYIPFAIVHAHEGNELVFLKELDPIKNIYGQTLSFMDVFRIDFIEHHRFSKPRLAYLDERPFYAITFKDKLDFQRGRNEFSMTGTIYIDAENHGIKKLNYVANIENGFETAKFYDLNIEYIKSEDQYFLNYLSFNNLFLNQAFVLLEKSINRLGPVMKFSREIGKQRVLTPDDFEISYQGKAQDINAVMVEGDSITLICENSGQLVQDITKLFNLSRLTDKEEYAELKNQLLSMLEIKTSNVYDKYGHTLSDNRFKEYYQYREFFVHERVKKPVGERLTLMDKTRPVFESSVALVNNPVDTAWINTPLIREENRVYASLNDYPAFSNLVLQHQKIDDSNPDETVYMQTDRELYAPEDTLWFKGYIRQKASLEASELSQTFYVSLIDSLGRIKYQDRFLIQNGVVKGQLPLDAGLAEGFYYLTGYTSWMKNQEQEDIYLRKILIEQEKRKQVKMMVAYDKESYFPGDTMRLVLSCVDEYNRKISDVRFNFSLKDEGKSFYKNRGKTTMDPKDNTFTVVLPENFAAEPQIDILFNYEHQGYVVSYAMPVNYFVDIRFYPEGGRLINGLESKIAFKAFTRYANPAAIEGNVYNQDGERVTHIKTSHLGAGTFLLEPKRNETYYLKLTKPIVFKREFKLPTAVDSGWQLSLQERLGRQIIAVRSQGMNNDSALITIMVRDKLMFYEAFRTSGRHSISVPLEELSPGVAVITLWNNRLIPQAERLFFVQADNTLSAEIMTHERSFNPRDSVLMDIKIKGDGGLPKPGKYSLTVFDIQMGASERLDEPTLATSLLLSSEIKGKILQPNMYFDASNPDRFEQLELLLLTQGWRNYSAHLEGIMDRNNLFPTNYETISGSLMKEPFGSGQKPTRGELSVLFGGLSTKIPVENDGRFSFLPEYEINNNSGVLITGYNPNGKTNVSIILDKDDFNNELERYYQDLSHRLQAYSAPPAYTYNRFEENFTFDLENHQWIEEVVIRKTVKKDEFTKADLALRKRIVPKEDIEIFETLEDIYNAYSGYFGFMDFEAEPIFFAINGFPQTKERPIYGEYGVEGSITVPDRSMIPGIFPEDIEEFALLKDEEARSMYGYKFQYIIDIKLKPPSERKSYRLYQNPVTIPKFVEAKQFYQPIYDTSEKRMSQIPDLRKTILWQPEVIFDEAGHARIKFYNGDRYTRIKCILEGITDDGLPVYSEYEYDVTMVGEDF